VWPRDRLHYCARPVINGRVLIGGASAREAVQTHLLLRRRRSDQLEEQLHRVAPRPAAHRSVLVIVGGPSKDTCLGGSRHALAAHNLRQRCCRCLPLSPLRSATLRPDEQLRIYTYGTGAVLGAVWQDWRAGCAPNENEMPMRTRGTRGRKHHGRAGQNARSVVPKRLANESGSAEQYSMDGWIDRPMDGLRA
jgi:hypothetical protein